jgi:hypothetical protein
MTRLAILSREPPVARVSNTLLALGVTAIAACEPGPAGPGRGAVPFDVRPTFLVIPAPNSGPENTSCDPGVAYQFSSHFVPTYGNRAEFKAATAVSFVDGPLPAGTYS